MTSVFYFVATSSAMIKKLLIFILILQNFFLFAQKSNKELLGKVKIDSISPESIHVINTSTNKATLTNENGEFRITVKENDTLLFTSVQIENKKVVILKKHLNSLQFIIDLKVDINELDEVIVKQHNLTGRLYIDNENTKLQHQVNAFTLKLPNAGKKKPQTEVDHINLRFSQFSGIVGSLYGWISGEKKKLKQVKKLAIEDAYIKKIKNFIKTSYFINHLKIPKDNIFHFLEFCKTKGIIQLYKEKKFTQLIEVITKESKLYIETFNNEK